MEKQEYSPHIYLAMADEFQTGIFGGNWWGSPRSAFLGGLSPCSMGSANDMGSWMADMVDLKARSSSCRESNHSVYADSSVVFQNSQKPQQVDPDHGGGGSILMDSTLQLMGFGHSSSSSSSPEWNQALLGSGRADQNYNSMLQEEMNSGLNSSQIQKDWSPRSLVSSTVQDSSITANFKEINQDFSLDQQRLNPVNSSGDSTATCEGISVGFSRGSASYGYSSPLINSLFEPDHPKPQQSPFNNRSMNLSPTSNYGANLNELAASWPKLSPFLKPSSPKQQPGNIHFSNNTTFWNASATALNDVRASLLASSQAQFLGPTFEQQQPNCSNLTTKPNKEEVRESGSVVKKESVPTFKRPRIETPSPLPTFKVRKEKLGDRITALQQLVSPFGKTDTASVLHEAIEYIKFLHDQVNALSTPYMKNGNSTQHSQAAETIDIEGSKQDLRSRGLCLVPISSTFPVANETTADFWTPTFGSTFR